MSSKSVPLVIFIIVMIGLIVGMLFYKRQSPTTKSNSQVTVSKPTATPTVNPNMLPAGTTDAQLNQDAQTIDQKMSSLSGDLNSVDQGLNDQQTNLQ